MAIFSVEVIEHVERRVIYRVEANGRLKAMDNVMLQQGIIEAQPDILGDTLVKREIIDSVPD